MDYDIELRFQDLLKKLDYLINNPNEISLASNNNRKLNSFDIKQPVFVLDIVFEALLEEVERFNNKYYIGTFRNYINEGLLLDLCIIPKIFYKYSYDEFSKSLDSK